MRQQGQVVEEQGPTAPAYLVTFTALVTLLMLFFVLMLALASKQDCGYVGKGRFTETQQSFTRAIRTLGLGILIGKKEKVDFGNIKIKYFISEADKLFEGRSIDAKREEVRRIFKKVSRTMKTMPSRIVAKRTNFSVTNIRFPPGEASLNEQVKSILAKFCLDLQQEVRSKRLKLYVLGLAGDEPTEKKQWILSAERAQAAADFIRNTLPPGVKYPVYSWGAGPGGDWVAKDSPISKHSQILIAVLRTHN